MADTPEVHKQCVSAKCALEQLLEDFDRGRDRSIATQQRLMMLNKNFKSSIEAFAPKATDIRWKKKLENLREDEKLFDSILQKQLGALFQQKKDAEDRERLMGDRGAGPDADMVNAAKREREMINNSAQMVNDMISSGAGIIGGLKGNQERMKGAHRKAIDVANQIGVSQGILNMVTSKNRQDQIIVYGCMAFTLFIFFGLYYWLKM